MNMGTVDRVIRAIVGVAALVISLVIDPMA